MKSVITAIAVSVLSATANASTAIVLVSASKSFVAEQMLEDWKNEKQLGEKLFTAGNPEVVTADAMKGLAAGHTALVLGVCDDGEAGQVLPVIQALYPTAVGKSVENAPSGCPKLTSNPTKVAKRHVDKGGNFTLTVVLFDGTWDKGETTQLAIAHVRDKEDTIVDTYSQRAGTVLGGETCKAELKQTGRIIAINRTCEGTKDVETKKLSLAKGRLKTE
ncbi:MAG: hypothetical protein ACAI38_12790 [Myxococcota bacterium]|nr:hypothetical protein [Myxococcota bacterium]